MNSNWQALFSERILKRGYSYYRAGYIQSYEADEKHFDAVVKGSGKSYEVKGILVQGDVKDVQCNCPYAKKSIPCKHIAAVLYHYDETAMPQIDLSDYQEVKWPLKELVNQLDETQMRLILTECADYPENLAGWIYALTDESKVIDKLILQKLQEYREEFKKAQCLREQRDVYVDCQAFLLQIFLRFRFDIANDNWQKLLNQLIAELEGFKTNTEGYRRLKETFLLADQIIDK